jgi:hypothetical protein
VNETVSWLLPGVTKRLVGAPGFAIGMPEARLIAL